MNTLKIYSFVSSVIVIGLSIWIYFLLKDLKETNEVLEQCSERYYMEINK
ncbi:hypothetical protein SAMN04489756_12425 [Cloacibacterium normanense]|nr:hypothetical protein SAMN04489756_12425 [Cloacibacterium normanense]